MTQSDPSAFWRKLNVKLAVALAVCLTVSALLAQSPTPPAPVADFKAPVMTDGNGYKYLDIFEKFKGKAGRKSLQDIQRQVGQVLQGQSPLADNRGPFTNYYQLYFFPLLTQTNDDDLKNLPDERQKFIKQHLEISGTRLADQEVHNTLTSLTLNTMMLVARDKEFHPAVRYNAMLLIGSLNDREAVRAAGAGGAAPVPMARALPFIFDEFKRADNTDAIRVAALLGLAHHLQWENEKPASVAPMSAADRQAIIDELLKLAQAKEPPQGRSAAGHVWLRRRAVEALGFAAAKKPVPTIATALDALLKDGAQPLDLRCTAAATIGKISYQQPVAIDSQAVAKELGLLALVGCDAELTRVVTQKKADEDRAIRLTGGVPTENIAPLGGSRMNSDLAGGMRPPGSGAEGMYSVDPSLSDPKHYRLEYLRRRLREILWTVQIGLTGGEDRDPNKLKKAAPVAAPPAGTATKGPTGPSGGVWAAAKPGEKQLVDDVYFMVRKLVETVEAKPLELVSFEKAMRLDLKALEAVTGPPPSPAAQPASPIEEGPLGLPIPAAAPAATPAAPVATPAAPARGPAGCQ